MPALCDASPTKLNREDKMKELEEQALTRKLTADVIKLAKKLDRYGVSRWELVAKAQAARNLNEVALCRDQLAAELARQKKGWVDNNVSPWAELACGFLYPFAFFASIFLIAAFVKFGLMIIG